MAAYRVLVVDDNHEVRRMVTASIKTLGEEIDVLDVPSAEEALFISTSLPLDLVVLDFRLPGMTGLEMLGRLRTRRPETKIILVTGVEDPATRQQIAEAGVEAYFFKPIDITTFLDAVKRSLWPTTVVPSQPASKAQPATMPPSQPVASVAPTPLAPTTEKVIAEPTGQEFAPSIGERLAVLKQQLKAVSALLVNDAGQVVEEAGSAANITTGSALLTALMHAFMASLHVSQAMAKGNCTSLQYFATQRDCLYITPVGMKHALVVVTGGFFEPDKLVTIDRWIQLAVRDLQTLLESQAAEEAAMQAVTEAPPTQLPEETFVDKETLAEVDELFSQAPDSGVEKQSDGFWESLEDDDASSGGHGKDVISYEQARKMGLAPEEDAGG